MFSRCPLCGERVNPELTGGHICYRENKKVEIPEQWEEEFETLITIHPNLEKEIKRYFEVDNLDSFKVKIKCRKGCIQIEKINS